MKRCDEEQKVCAMCLAMDIIGSGSCSGCRFDFKAGREVRLFMEDLEDFIVFATFSSSFGITLIDAHFCNMRISSWVTRSVHFWDAREI